MVACVVMRDDPQFPERLLVVKPEIKQLWYRGLLDPILFKKTVAVVGSRRMSRYGRQVIQEIVPEFCRAGYTIISGLMYGVDQLAHQTALECGGSTVAVLGYGIERQNEEGADRMAESIINSGGAVLSEYPGTTRGQTWTFPQRNRIVVGLSDLVIIIEAGERSGSLNTASWARRMSCPVYAAPGSIFSTTSQGTNGLVAQGMAKILTRRVIDELLGQSTSVSNNMDITAGLSKVEREVVNKLILLGPKNANELSRAIDLSPQTIIGTLSQLEMKGVVVEERGVWGVIT